MTPEQEEIVLKLGRDRVLAHQSLFRHRHSDTTPPCHAEIINIWHGPDPHALVMMFREGGKSTIAEEAFVIGAAYQLFHNALIIGATERRACERLRAIKHEIETNENLAMLFGSLKGPVWNEAEIILSNGVRIIAVGRGQSLRGTKHLHYRPDFCFCDDIEEDEHVRTPEARDETLSWFMATVIPALDKTARIRVNATPLDREALPFVIEKRLKWPTKTFPIEYVDDNGERQPTWPARYPLEWIDNKKSQFEAAGKIQDYMREYMCVADDPTKKLFTRDMFRVEPRERVWQPTFAFFDPARTVRLTSATTGWAVWSWIGNRLIVWDGGGNFWKPDEIVNKTFEVDQEYRPIQIGVEIDGLHEFLEQPLRQEQARRGYLLPLRSMKAPKGKLQFIQSLQPFFVSGEITFAKPCPELETQFLNYPSGKIDGPNALAYALLMRPGQVIYENFGADNVADVVSIRDRDPCWLCLNGRAGYTTGVLAQFSRGVLNIVGDYVREGDPGSCVASIVREASLEAGTQLRLVCGPDHYSGYNHLGLRGAVARIPADLRRGTAVEMGRRELGALLSTRVRDGSGVRVSLKARWTLNAFTSGFCFEISKTGMLSSEPADGPYRCLIEGLEAFTGMISQSIMSDHGRPNVQYTPSGQRYVSALPGKGAPDESKDTYLGGARLH
jgi:hypothetical protein